MLGLVGALMAIAIAAAIKVLLHATLTGAPPHPTRASRTTIASHRPDLLSGSPEGR